MLNYCTEHGSGKTLTIAAKVKYLIDFQNVNPESILLIAFTNKSANEMTERIQKILNTKTNVRALTFHKLGLKIIYMAENLQKSNENTIPDLPPLSKNSKIDFSDMIQLSTELVEKNKVPLSYQYIIIDEYQDISYDRYRLVKAIKDKTKAKLTCVGDDWQSIFGFSGNDIDLFCNFEKYFGKTQIVKLKRTYRNSKGLIAKASLFIQQNPDQIKKKLTSHKRLRNPIIACKYSFEPTHALRYALHDIYQRYGEKAEVLLLGRTKYDLNDYVDNKIYYSPKTRKVIYILHPDMQIQFMTIHEAKGLEADNVIILNMKDAIIGFPNKMENESDNKETYPYAEERRLFYVALTRTRNRVYLMVPTHKPSLFYQELSKITWIKTVFTEEEQELEEVPICPICKKNHLKLKESDGIKYWFCSNCDK
ncbi:MAG: UvrD-helicase domain-containing protein [Clostridia bacterium]|nr:UvrD-helicase domain-containing protein [Clostridia bacterium]